MAPFSYSKYLLIGLPVVVLAGFAALWWQGKEKRRSFEEIGRVSGLFIYPVKSCKGIPVDDVKCFKEGMEFDRCPITTVNPATGEKEGEEPLHTLRRIRLPEDRDPRQGISPRFGVHVAPEGDKVGVIRIGDSVMVSV